MNVVNVLRMADTLERMKYQTHKPNERYALAVAAEMLRYTAAKEVNNVLSNYYDAAEVPDP